jgi:hypothetical protein
MKKALTILVAMLFIVAVAGIAYSAETTFNGQYKVRAWSEWNFDKRTDHMTSERGLYTGFFDQRFRLTITHTRSEFLKAVVQLDLVEDVWGQQRNFRINNAYTKLYPTGFAMNNGFVRKAYIEFTLPKIGTFTVGKQPVVLGYGLAFSDSSGYLDGLKWSNKWGPVAVSAMYFKWDDNVSDGGATEYYNRDADYYLLDVHITPNENHDIELFGAYANIRSGVPDWDRHMSWPWANNNGIETNLGLVGIAYTGEIANMISLKGEFSYLFGRADTSVKGPAWRDDAHLSGYNLYLDAAYHNDLLTVGAAFVLGSGQTLDGVNAQHYNVNMLTADEFAFGNIIASGNGGVGEVWSTGLGFDDDIENLTAAKLYFKINPLCCDGKLSLNAAVIWARWTEDVGTTRPYGHPASNYSALAYAAWYGSKAELGWEVDFGLSYEIMEGLTYSLNTGVLFTGDSWDYNVGGTHQDWGPIWMVNNEILYEF